MTTIGKSCIELIDFVKKVKGLRKVRQANVLDKRPKSTSNLLDYHSRGLGTLAITVHPVQLAMSASIGGYFGKLYIKLLLMMVKKLLLH